MSFENYLIELGYKKQVYDSKSHTIIDANQNHSIVKNIAFIYTKENHNQIVWGLDEINRPSTLLSPRPKFIKDYNEMNAYLLSHTNEELYNLIN